MCRETGSNPKLSHHGRSTLISRMKRILNMIFTLMRKHTDVTEGRLIPLLLLHLLHQNLTRTEHTHTHTTNTLKDNRWLLVILNRCKTKISITRSILTFDYLKEKNACQCWKVFLEVGPVLLSYIWLWLWWWWCHSSCLSASFPLQCLSFKKKP